MKNISGTTGSYVDMRREKKDGFQRKRFSDDLLLAQGSIKSLVTDFVDRNGFVI